MDTTHVDAVRDREISRLIEKRAEVGDPEALEETWKRSAVRHQEKIRRQNRWEWVRFFDRMAASHARLAEDYERRANELCESEAMEGAT